MKNMLMKQKRVDIVMKDYTVEGRRLRTLFYCRCVQSCSLILYGLVLYTVQYPHMPIAYSAVHQCIGCCTLILYGLVLYSIHTFLLM